jgi:trigger factor
MQVTLEQLEPCKVAVRVEVDAEAVKAALDDVFTEIAGKVAVPGFRKGRAPRPILERYIEAEVVRDRAVSKIVPEYLARAIEEQGIEPIAHPEVEMGTLEAGQAFHFTATVPTRPRVRLCDYHDVPATRRRVEVSDEDVDLELDLLRRRNARLEDAEAETATAGLVAVVDLDSYRGPRRLKNRSRADLLVDMDDTQGVPAFNVAIEGARIGETREMPVRYPPDHRDPVFAGKEILHKLTVKALKHKVVPELTDEFARSVGNVDNVEELRAKVRSSLEATAAEVADNEVRDQVLEYVVARSEVHFPDVLVQEQVADMLSSRAEALEERGLTLDDYLGARGIDYATYERELREEARRLIRTQLVVEEVTAQEKIEVTDEEVDEEIARMARAAGAPTASVRAALEQQGPGARRAIRLQLLFRKTTDLLRSFARITEE